MLCRTASPELSLSSTLAFAGPLQVNCPRQAPVEQALRVGWLVERWHCGQVDKDLITLSEVEDVVARR